MIEAIKNILRKWGCCHEWKLEQEFEISDKEEQITKGYKFLYICKKCGKMKWVKTSVN